MHLSPEKAAYCLFQAVPAIVSEEKHFRIGKCVSLEYLSPLMSSSLAKSSAFFSQTGISLRLLETISSIVKIKGNVLLVGETGTGKTTIIQTFASLARASKFAVINLSQQSEREDLIGGFKPLTQKALFLQLNDEFERLFKDSFNATKN